MACDLIHLLTCWWLGMTRYDSLNSWEMNARRPSGFGFKITLHGSGRTCVHLNHLKLIWSITNEFRGGSDIYIYLQQTGWWFQPLWKILVSWDYFSQYMGKCSKPPTRQGLGVTACDFGLGMMIHSKSSLISAGLAGPVGGLLSHFCHRHRMFWCRGLYPIARDS